MWNIKHDEMGNQKNRILQFFNPLFIQAFLLDQLLLVLENLNIPWRADDTDVFNNFQNM